MKIKLEFDANEPDERLAAEQALKHGSVASFFNAFENLMRNKRKYEPHTISEERLAGIDWTETEYYRLKKEFGLSDIF